MPPGQRIALRRFADLPPEQHLRMTRDENIGADTSGRNTDIGGSTSGGKAGDDPADALRDLDPDVDTPGGSGEPQDDPHGTPDDLKPGRRRTVGQDEDAGAGSGVPGDTASD